MYWEPLTKLGLKLENGYINIGETCWMCPTKNSLEDHHIIPRCSGGENGPQVRICSVCHSAIHKAAISAKCVKGEWVAGNAELKTFNAAWTTETQLLKSYLLASVIRSAAQHVKGDDNKTAKYSTTWSGEYRKIISDLKNATGIRNQDKVIRLALKQLHQRYYKR
ncbi:hypothetical protein GR7B_00105 [Vibrio phage vB_VcorM_GR7B]|nr:hypothetical protein GR7B_00105 [Vibrio phage vB_VcorM_GR7B]